jgi:hypothetical protein
MRCARHRPSSSRLVARRCKDGEKEILGFLPALGVHDIGRNLLRVARPMERRVVFRADEHRAPLLDDVLGAIVLPELEESGDEPCVRVPVVSAGRLTA